MNRISSNFSRRHFLGLSGMAVVGLATRAAASDSARGERRAALGASGELESILQRIQAPEFPAHDWVVTEFGATGDGRTNAQPAFTEAIRQCNAAGGGRVVVPAGEWWLEGPLHLKSNVHLHLDDRAVLRFRTDDPALYLPVVLTRWEGTELFNYSPLIYAYQARNVAITGGGLLDGNALDTIVKWRPRQGPDQLALRKMGADGLPLPQRVFGAGHWLRPNFVQFFGCTNVLCDGFSLRDSPFWCVHAVASQNVIARRLRIESAPVNSDGFDPESSADVLIEDCNFNVGDDCIAIKSGRDEDAWRIGRPCENIVIRRCRFNAPGSGSGIAIGSEMSGGVRNVYVEAAEMRDVNTAINIKGNLDRGGRVEHVRIHDVSVQRAGTLVLFTTDYHGYRGGQHPPVFRDFVLEDIRCDYARAPLHAVGVRAAPLQDVTLRNFVVRQAAQPPLIREADHLELDRVRINGVLVPAGG